MEILGLHHLDGVPYAGLNVLDLEVWIVIPHDLRKGNPLSHQLQHLLNGYPGTGDARSSKVNVWAYLDSFPASLLHLSDTGLARVWAPGRLRCPRLLYRGREGVRETG